MKTFFEQVLETLRIPYTRPYARSLYMEHPDRDNFLGLKQMLGHYRVEVRPLQIADKSEFFRLPLPFVAEVADSWALVTSTDGESVGLIWKNEQKELGPDEFLRHWSGACLLLSPTAVSSEPDYRVHRRREIWEMAEWVLIALASCLCLPVAWLAAGGGWLALARLSAGLSGSVVSLLLMEQGIRRNGGISGKLCHLFSKSGCHGVLDSAAARLPGGYDWSEVGFAFFTGNLLSVLALGEKGLVWMSFAALAALPYTFWSLWYQGFRLKTWCPLCVTVQLLLWILAGLGLLAGDFRAWPRPDFQTLLIPAFCGLTLVLARRFSSLVSAGLRQEALGYELVRLKNSRRVFETQLTEGPRHLPDGTIEPLVLSEGRAGLPVLTVVSNPYCNPCSRLHTRLEALREAGFPLRYVLTAFSPELMPAGEHIMAYRRTHDAEATWRMLTRWFSAGRADAGRFWSGESPDTAGAIPASVAAEARRQTEWCESEGILATPTVLVGGYRLPELYSVEDLLKIYRP